MEMLASFAHRVHKEEGHEQRTNIVHGFDGSGCQATSDSFLMMKEMDFSDIDGNFGPKTQEAVKSF
jgi:peptidoglycan hydrolase-like protein with peptidoglycan-binding domain